MNIICVMYAIERHKPIPVLKHIRHQHMSTKHMELVVHIIEVISVIIKSQLIMVIKNIRS